MLDAEPVTALQHCSLQLTLERLDCNDASIASYDAAPSTLATEQQGTYDSKL